MLRKGKWAAIAAAIGAGICVACAIVFLPHWIEHWHLARLEHATPEERLASGKWLARSGSRDVLPALVSMVNRSRSCSTPEFGALLEVAARVYGGAAELIEPLRAAGIPLMVGAVKAVEAKEKLVLLSVGKDQLVELGTEFAIVHAGAHVGTVKVIKVYPDVSGAEILDVASGMDVQRGDQAVAWELPHVEPSLRTVPNPVTPPSQPPGSRPPTSRSKVALVMAIDARQKLVFLSVGQELVELGTEFTIFRQGTRIGSVKVIKFFPHMSGAEILETTNGLEIRRGDEAVISEF